MIKHTFEDISTGGGFNHYWITFPEYGFGVLVNDEGGGALPKEGKRFDIGVYRLEDGKYIGEHFENSFNTLDNFSHAQIIPRVFGYVEGLGLAKKKEDKRIYVTFYTDNFELSDDSKLVNFEFFSDDMGYDEASIHMIDKLGLNETLNLSECHNPHLINRVI